MANVMAVVAFACCFTVMHTGTLVWISLMLPGLVGRVRIRLEAAPIFCLTWGAFLLFAAFVVSGLLLPQREAGFSAFGDLLTQLSAERFPNDVRILTHVLGWLALGPLMAAWVLGGAGFARLFADRASQAAVARSPSGGLVGGAVCLSVAYLLPFVGWFVFMPLVGAMSVGAGAVTLVTRRPPDPAPARDGAAA